MISAAAATSFLPSAILPPPDPHRQQPQKTPDTSRSIDAPPFLHIHGLFHIDAAAAASAASLPCAPSPQRSVQTKIGEGKSFHLSEARARKHGHALQLLCRKGLLDAAVHMLHGDDHIWSTPLSTSAYLCMLKECIRQRCSAGARAIYAHIAFHRIDLNAESAILGDYLVMALARCGELEEAHAVAESLMWKLTVYSWSALISVHAEHGRGPESLRLYQIMLEDGLHPDEYTFVALFRACGSVRDLSRGKQLHSEARSRGYADDVFVCNSIIGMYSKCGDMEGAEEVFRTMVRRDVVSWNAMLSGYVEMERGEQALLLLRQMHREGGHADNHTCVVAIRACCIYADGEASSLGMDGGFVKPIALSIGEGLHADAKRRGFIARDVYVGTALLSMYAKCGTLAQAELVFGGLPQRNSVSWNAMLSAYVDRGKAAQALRLYRHMLDEGVPPDHLTRIVALQACGLLVHEGGDASAGDDAKTKKQLITALDIGRALHAQVLRDSSLDAFTGTTLVDMYGKCGVIEEAEHVFCEMPERTAISWVAMMSAYVERGRADEALRLYCMMTAMHEAKDAVCSDRQIFVVALQACAMLAEEEKGKRDGGRTMAMEIGMALHADACGHGHAWDAVVATAIVRMYCQCGSIADAELVLGAMNGRGLMVWTIMLGAYVERGQGEKALGVLGEMRREGVAVDEVAIMCLLQAAGQVGSLELCCKLHFAIVASGCDDVVPVMASLVHAYGSCASMSDGQAVFDELRVNDLVSWTSCISGYTIEGDVNRAFLALEHLLVSGLRPDGVAFCSLLSACSHSGYVRRAIECFDSMARDHKIVPGVEHYEVIVDAFARAESFAMAEKVLLGMPTNEEVSASMWMSLLAYCARHGLNNLQTAKEAFDATLCLRPLEAGPYISMANAWASLPALE